MIEFLPMAVKTSLFQFFAGFIEGKHCGCNLCLISNPSPLVKTKMYSLMRRVPTVLVPAQHFNKTNFQEIVEGVYVFDECTSIKINTLTVSIYN